MAFAKATFLQVFEMEHPVAADGPVGENGCWWLTCLLQWLLKVFRTPSEPIIPKQYFLPLLPLLVFSHADVPEIREVQHNVSYNHKRNMLTACQLAISLLINEDIEPLLIMLAFPQWQECVHNELYLLSAAFSSVYWPGLMAGPLT